MHPILDVVGAGWEDVGVSYECPVCGEEHEDEPVGQPGTWLEGIALKLCPQIPEDCIYEDREYDSGPRGALHKLRLESS